VNTTRSYRSPRRENEAASTRRDILAAARVLFTTHGYPRVTVADIAREANVAAKTVYASAGSKSDILNELISAAVVDSGAEATLAEVQGSVGLQDAMEILARGTRAGNETHREAIDLMYTAMSAHDDAEVLWRRGTEMYRTVLGEIAAHLEGIGALADGVEAGRAADMLWFCFGTNAWRTLVKDCGWTWDDAERWLGRQAIVMLGG
jgi:AcrR family transcriptional regulator